MLQRLLSFFFFQAEDGIRDVAVTGVQTCALPILTAAGEIRLATGQEAFRQVPSGGLAYLGTASYREMETWAQIRRASCRGRGEISEVAVSFKKKKDEY